MLRTISKAGLIAGAAAAVCGFATLPVKADNDDYGNNSYQSTPMNMHRDQMRYYHMAPSIQGHTGIRVVVNGQPVDFNGPGPIMVGGDHVFVPVRGVFEQMGGYVQWHQDDQVVHGFRPGGHEFRIQIGSNTAMVNGVQQSIDTPPILRDGSTYVPLRFASEALGAHVHWSPDTNTVAITTHDGDRDRDYDNGNIDR